MRFIDYLIFLGSLAALLHVSHGCEVSGITNWNVALRIDIYDVFEGEIFAADTTGIDGVTATFDNSLNEGKPYYAVQFDKVTNRFSIITGPAFKDYEEYETEMESSVTVTFNCVGGSRKLLVFMVNLTDTNNNDPLFRPDNVYEFTVVTPLTPGFRIGEIMARDIDLTTFRVEFLVIDNKDFLITETLPDNRRPKEFHALLTATNFIRSIPEPIEFKISATDFDNTGDESRTTHATVRIKSDGEFELPEEPVFSRTFYMATYTNNHEVVLQDTISLRQGYDEEVKFSLKEDPEFAEYFSLVPDGNEIHIRVDKKLPVELLRRNQILLVVQAERDLTSGASATVIIQLPEGRIISFAQAWYVGKIVEGTATLPPLPLTDGYDLAVQLNPRGDFSTYFKLTRESNNVIVTMDRTLPPEIIDENSFIILDVEASYPEAVTGHTTIVFELIKQPIIAPVFDEAFYSGQYSKETGLLFEQTIRLKEGFDESVDFDLDGDDSEKFRLVNRGQNSFTIELKGTEIARLSDRHQLVFSVVATKPDTTPGLAALVITLTGPIISFGQASYAGKIVEGSLQLPPLALVGANDLPVRLSVLPGAFSSYFTVARESNNAIVTLSPNFPPEMVEDNAFISLDIEASYPGAVSGFTAVILEVVKEPIVAPVFDQAYYAGQYSEERGLRFDQTIRLKQGFDDSVIFILDGDDSKAFNLDRQGQNSYTLSVVPSEMAKLSERHQLVFSVVATKPDTTPARAALVITLTGATISFVQASYAGKIVEGTLQLPPLVLVGANDLPVRLNVLPGAFSSYFTVAREANNAIVTMSPNFPPEMVEENAFISLDIEASYPGAVSGFTAVILEVVKEPIVVPVFDQAYYAGQYSEERGLRFEQTIRLKQGFDDSVIFTLDGDDSKAFHLDRQGQNSYTLSVVPSEMAKLSERHQLVFSVVAAKPDTTPARAALVITLTDAVLSFERASYEGKIVEGSLQLSPLTIIGGSDLAVQVNFLPTELSQHFTLTRESNNVIIMMKPAIPPGVLENNALILLDIEASYPGAVSGFTTVVLEVVKEPIEIPIFNEPYYIGQYSQDSGLEFDQTIKLAQGFDESVLFTLAGDDSEAFRLEHLGPNRYRLLIKDDATVDMNNRNKLVFSVVATKPYSISGRAAIIVALKETTTDRVLGFDRVNYLGSLTEDTVNLQPITLRDGFGTDVRFTLHGDLQQHFTHVEQGDTVFVRLEKPIPAQSLPENGIIILKIQASAPQTVPAVATIVLEVKHTETPPTPTLPDPVFAAPFYTATLISNNELETGTPISLAEGYDSSVILDLEGDGSQWFDLERSANSARLILRTSNPIPPSVVASREQLVFVVTAQRPESAVARATVIVTWREETTTDRVLGFDRVNYLGSLTEDTVNLQPITLRDGFGTDVRFTLHGDLQQHFTHVEQGDTVFVRLEKPIPAQSLPENGIIILKIQASAPQTVPAVATIVLEVKHTETPPTPTLPDPVFAAPFYTATLISNNELETGTPISLAEGYDSSVILDLEGDGSQWFDLERSANSARLILRTSNPIPPSVVASREQLVFVVTAQRPESAVARATVIVTWREETTTDRVLGFDRVNYLGSLTEDTVNLQPITLRDGFGTDVRFTLHGDLQQHFTHVEQGDTVFVRLEKPIPAQSLPENGIIILKIQASAPQTVPAVATIVLEVKHTETPPTPTLPDPVFAAPFYTATLISNNELETGTPISLAEGYDSSVILDLEGDGSQWFDLERSANSARLILRTSNPIPPSVVASREQLVFVVTAQRPESAVARATVIVTWREETTTDRVLGFDRVNYLGSLTEDTVNLQPITLRDGFGTDVRFTLHGDLQQHFTHVEQGDTVFVRLEKPIPAQSLPENGIIILKIQASAPQTVPAVATIVLEVQHTETPPTPTLPDPVFAAPFYTATLISNNELETGTPISLAEGYDSSVILDLEGDGSQWFDLERSANSARLILRTSNPIPPSVVASREQLVFVVTAQRPESAVARATVIVTWREETTTDRVLGFDRVNYLGSLTEDTVNLQPITLRDGFGTDVRFTLHGDLQQHFTHVEQGDTVFVRLEKPIPAQSLPENGIIILKIQASAPQTVPAVATIVLEVQHTETPPTPTLPDPVFAAPFYTATLISNNELETGTPISLAEGYDSSVILDLEGDGSQWFDLERSANSARLILRTSNPIPPSVVASREQLVFVVTAQRPESAVARATVIVTWREETTTDRVLGFDRVNYLGSLTEDTVNLQPITLRDGFGTDVRFTLHGDLQQHFTHVEQGDTVFVRLEKPIPAQSLPENGIIILKIQASAPQTVPAVATIVLEVQHTETPPTPTLPDPVFAAPFYTATLISNNELESGTPISLAEGYDSSVILDLEGDGSQWFDLERSANSARLILRTSNPIPPSVVASREQLVFVVTAQRPESAVARATVIVTWREETTTDRVLGFDRVNYLGSLTEDTVNLQPITLRDGFGTDVRFTLHGDLQQHFTHVEQGDTVFVRLEKPIPAQSLPENGIIILKIQASAPQTVPAVATIVLEVKHTETPPTPTLPDPVFAAPFYTATLISNNELETGTPISLAEGYDSSVILDLEGDGSQWFDLERSANSARLILRTSNPIPPSVVASREQLVFVVTAQRPESAVARATVIVTWREETTTDRVLGFDRVNYLGSLTEDTVNLQPITLRDGFGTDVRFTLHGDLQQHFTHVEQGDTVFVRLEKPIPAQSLPENGIIILKIQASAPQTVPAVATIVLEVQHTETPPTPTLPDPVFAAPFYTATLISNNELETGTPISLAEGYDSSVILDLEGDGSQWFDLERSANSARLILRTSNPIPPSVVASREQLVFVVTAQRPESAVARATVIVTWREETTTDRVLGFDRVNYLGSLTEDTVNLQPITLRDGFGTDVRFTLHGDLQQHFTHVEQGDTVFVRLEKPIPAQSLPENGIIILKIQASAPQTVPAVATIVLEVQHTETPPTPTLPDPVFAAPFYTATLISNNELESGTPISLAEGYDSSVILDLEGDGSQWFDLERSANSARLILRTSNPIPPSVVASREQLVFVVTAQRPESAVARATVIVTWREETTTDRVLGFDRVNYLGSLTEDTVNLQPITLRDGFGTDVRFTLHGDLQQHFTHVEQGDTVFVRLEKPIPAQSLPENGIIILKIQASAPQTVPAVATIVLEVKHTETPPTPTLPDPVFAAPFYTATLISNNELETGTPISLAEGYDSSVILDLEGDGSQWFDLERSANSARLILRTSNPIPPSVVASREQLVFVVTAQRPESAVARATVIVTWREETTTDRVLGFDRVNYLGSLTEDTVNLQPITLRDGFGTDVRFTLHGDLQQHFTHVEQGDTVFVRLEKPIPAQSLPENGIIILKIQASAPQTVPAVATIVLEVQHTETPPTPTLPDPVFAAPFYTATLISNNELESGTPISLAEGYDSSVILDLEGDGSQWFDLERSANSARLILRTSNPIPPSVVASREQLVFVVTAQRPESAVARATVIVTWREETTTDRVLGFDRVNYLGSLTEDTVNLQPITLRDGFGTDVRFTLHGDLQQHFTHVEQGDTVFVRLEKPIPAQSLPENGIIILKIQASAPQTVPAVATIVLEVQHTETPPTPTLPDPVFAAPFYTATLISNNELESGTPISLAEGYDSSVILDLEGDGSQWFDLERSANSARLILRTSNPIPPSVVASREQLVFVVTAQRPESAVARATVIVTWREETTTDRVLGFDRVNYLGSLTEDTVNLQPITLRDGFGTDVRFTLHGDLQQHFTHVEQGDTVFVRLEKPIPAQSLPENGIIILKIQASAPQTVPAVATIVLEVKHTETPPTPTLPDPVFAAPFYTATLISNNELETGTPISLAEGYDSSVILDLEGDGSQWFDLERSANSARLILRTSNPIPPSVVASREQLVFVVTAQRPESAVARATVIVTWREETTTDRVLGFDRVNYLGSLTEDTVNLQPITLRDGFGTDVRFTLHGDLQQHFTHVEQGDTVFVRLEKPIPAQSLPENGIIILKIQASAPQTVPAVATIVLEVKHTETPPTPTLPDPVFAAPFYTATLISNNELETGTPISLAEGYDSSVILDLEGDGSQWFDLERSANSARLILRTSNPIPPSVVASREQLVFVVTAQRPESAVARATVIVTWREETTTDRVLGFDRVNYLGSLTEDTVNLQPITLRDGFGTDVRFTLHGDLQQHFTHVEQGDTVFVRLEKPIPAQSLPENGIIILKIQASAPQTVPAVATIVLEVQHTETPPTPTLPDPVFAAPFYTATLISNNELESGTSISLAKGYDSSVILDLEGDGSQWFDLERSANSARLILRTSNPIPPSVVASREQLVFVVTAQRPESAVARATVIVTWREETTTDRVLGFDRVNYLGSLTEDTVNLQPITLRDGFGTDVRFTLHGDLQQHFTHVEQGDTVFVRLEKPIPAQSLPENGIIILKIQASAPQTVPAVATIVLEVQHTESPPTPTLPDPVFAAPFYTATLISNNELESGTPISLAEGYDSSVILDLEGDGSQWFDLERSANSARLILRTSNPIPPSVVASGDPLIFIVIAQRQDSAITRATIVILFEFESPVQPATSVTFDSASYVLRVDVSQTGVVGQVRASADNGERIIYSLELVNEHLRSRISVNSDGDLRLSAPADSGVYNFKVVATAAFSSVKATTSVHLLVDALTVCGDEPAIAPLIVLNRDEEQPLRDLVLLNPTEHKGCRYSLTNRWPVDQKWLYVDDSGLHSTAIDREDPSIAFMALSQVQVELTLNCDSDVSRTKRFIDERLNRLGSYGTNTWLLGETIRFNRRRSIVNLIVNDINDNAPIFAEDEIIVGYPVLELEQTVLPRSLAELKATDADVGENAALVYWSSEPQLAVSPTTGFVHVRNEQQLEQDQILTVNVTDLNGNGHTGSINLMVKLLDASNIAVVTVRDAFLEDEGRILGNISSTIGYGVRSLRSVVISETEGEQVSRKKREVVTTEATLQMFVYGLAQREPVSVERLKTDIGEASVETVYIASIQTLDDHMESIVVRDSGHDVGLLVATIILSVLLFLLILAIIIWFLLKRRKKNYYDEFSDENSLASQNETPGQLPKALDAATALAKPRLNIEELKRSEKRLQDLLNAPIEEITVEPTSSKADIVIQDKLKNIAEESDEDEYGETKIPRGRKSVVTFNENVEKIIHVDETADKSNPDYEVYRL